jgi:hypothetical protein
MVPLLLVRGRRSLDSVESHQESPMPIRNRDEEDEDRPRRQSREAEEDERDSRTKRGERDARRDRDDRDDRDGEDERGERSARKRRREDDEDGPGRVTKKGGVGVGVVLAILGGLFLVCCGGVGLGSYLYIKARDKAQQFAQNIETWNPTVNKTNSDALQVGTTTRVQAELTLGVKGRMATANNLETVFGSDKSSIASWTAAVDQKRAVIWQNGDDYLLAMCSAKRAIDRAV